jgi:hypothetical protein
VSGAPRSAVYGGAHCGDSTRPRFACDVSQLICGVWRCRLRAWCAPVYSVRHVYGGAHCQGLTGLGLCSDVSQLICGVWWCRLRVRCVPIRSVRWGSLRGFHPALFRVRRVPAHLWSLAMSTACLVRPGLQRPPRVRWGSLSGSHRPRFVGLALRTFPCRQSFLVFPLGPYC